MPLPGGILAMDTLKRRFGMSTSPSSIIPVSSSLSSTPILPPPCSPHSRPRHPQPRRCDMDIADIFCRGIARRNSLRSSKAKGP
eukprot:5161009-Pyramimonas_sp.AAC.1